MTEPADRGHRAEAVPLIERMISGKIQDLMTLVESREEYSEEPDRPNRLAEIFAVLVGLRYAIEKGELPKLAAKVREFLQSVNPDRN